MKPSGVLYLGHRRLAPTASEQGGGLLWQDAGPGEGRWQPLASAAVQWVCLDWAGQSVSGVATLPGKLVAARAQLERQLRDQGELDEVSRVCVHHHVERGGSTELVYTAVPQSTWHAVHQQVGAGSGVVLLHDWMGALLRWCMSASPSASSLTVLHPGGVDLVLVSGQQVEVVQRLRSLGTDPDEWRRLAHMVANVLQQHQGTLGGHRPSEDHVWLLATDPTPIAAFLSAGTVGEHTRLMCLPAAKDVLAQGGGAHPLPELWDLSVLASVCVPQAALNPALDKAAAWAWSWLPGVGLAACVLATAFGVAAWQGHQKNQRLLELSAQPSASDRWARLQQTVNAADAMAREDESLKVWLNKRIGARNTPDFRRLLSDIRTALPAGVLIEEVGLVTDKGQHLITITGRVDEMHESLRLEGRVAEALTEVGYVLVKRELMLREGKPGFKLSMTWGVQ
jgi:hypothetical protein